MRPGIFPSPAGAREGSGVRAALGWRAAHRVACTLAGLALAAFTPYGPASAQESRPRLYEVVTETDMPHLEENLRYAVRREQHCLDRNDLSTVFWMLSHASLQDCRLVKTAEDAGSATYRLQCEGGHGTTGDARWQFEAGRMTGTLRVRLGGKNMTFYQRITAKPANVAAGC
jgi:hypothetical protein